MSRRHSGQTAQSAPIAANFDGRHIGRLADQAQHYKFRGFAQHNSIDHSKFEWTQGDVHTNTLEGFSRS